MHVLIIGGSGFIGTRMARLFLEAGFRVTALTRGQRPLPAGVAGIVADRKVPAALAAALGDQAFDAVVDLQCYSAEDAAGAVEAFMGRVGHFVFLSTDFVYGGLDLPLIRSEACPRQSWGAYGRKKAEAEDVFARAWQERQFPVSWLRPPHILGAGSKFGAGALRNRDPMLPDMLRRGVPIIVIDDGAWLIQPAVHHEIAQACLAMFGKAYTFGQGYNMAGAAAVTSRRYFQIVGEAVGCEARFLSLPSSVYLASPAKNEPATKHRVYDMGKLQRDTGFAPAWTLPQAIADTVAGLASCGGDVPWVADPAELRLRDILQRGEAEALQCLTAG